MLSAIQDNRTVRVKTSLPASTLLFSSMHGHEHLSQLFHYTVELLSHNQEIDFNKLLGSDMTIHMERPDNGDRFFHGFVSDAAQCENRGEFAVYRFTLKPWLWFLTRTADCRIFQDMSVPDILDDIFRSEGFTDVDIQLMDQYPVRNYCVQYQESDFAFVSRLMEQEGIYYYFRQEDSKHTLVLCDNLAAHKSVPGYEHIPVHSAEPNPLPDSEFFSSVSLRRKVQSGRVATSDFNFVQPGDNMLAGTAGEAGHAHAGYEWYDYNAEYPSASNGVKVRDFGERSTRYRIEALQAEHELTELEGMVTGPGVGDLFSLVGAERIDRNREYLIVESVFDFSLGGYAHTRSDEGFRFNARMQVMCTKVQYRAPRRTPRPVMQGPQTAIVVGPKGDEIYTDKHGRVKLQFHWDRYGTADENSSCWVRVSQAWAGGQYGAIHIPRINNEVIVEFINGDPDQPIVTGRVYNGDNAVPYDLPGNATQSGIKSRSSHGGNTSNFNEIRMEDKKGSEELFIHAERNHTLVTKADRSESVGHDRSLTVGNDKTESVGANRTLTVNGNKTETIEADKTIKVKGNFTETINGSSNIEILQGNASQGVKDGTMTLTSKKKLTIDSNANMELHSDTDMQLESDTKLTLKVGDSRIVMTPGKIEISAAVVEIKGKSMISSQSEGANKLTGVDVSVDGSASVKVTSSAISMN